MKAGAGAAKGGKAGGKGGAMVKIQLEVVGLQLTVRQICIYFTCSQVEKDAKKLVSQVCGANYVTGSDPILIKVRQETKL